MSESDELQTGTKSVDSLDDLEGGYMYEGDGLWYRIKGFRENGDELVIDTRSISHESVPLPVKDRAYGRYDDQKTVIVTEEVR